MFQLRLLLASWGRLVTKTVIKRMSKGITVTFIFLKAQHCTSNPLKGLKKTTIRPAHNSWPAGQESKLGSLEYEGTVETALQ